MYPASFEYFAPTTLEEAGEILARFGDEAKVLAGGQSLIPLMKLRFASPKALVDVNGIAGLDGLAEEDGALRIGALVHFRGRTYVAIDGGMTDNIRPALYGARYECLVANKADGPRTDTEYSFQPSNDERVMLLLPKIASPASDTWILTCWPPPSVRCKSREGR